MAFPQKFVIFLATISISWARDYYIRSERDVLQALNSVRPGDTIYLASNTLHYFQNVELLQSGQPYSPITLTGSKGTKISSLGTALVVRGSFWKIQNIDFEKSPVGLIVHGSNNTLKGLVFSEIDEESLVFRGNGNTIKNSIFNGCNHGVVITGRDNVLFKNSITCLSTSVSATPRSCCGRLEGNVFNGLLTINGAEYHLLKNIANSDLSIGGARSEVKLNVVNGRLDVGGCGNSFFGNTVRSSQFTTTCYNWDEGKNNFGNGGDPNKRPVNHPTVVQASN